MPDALYIHIPFCVKKCVYCDFFSVPFDSELSGRYVDSLCRELSLKKSLTEELRTVYIGGGTPTLLGTQSIAQLFECLSDHYRYAPDAEITVEANPGTLSSTKIEELISFGVNRLSIGVQSFQNSELKILGRIHTADEAARVVEAARTLGINNISVDLMYGIPGQTLSSWANTLARTVELEPMHISTYELTPAEQTPFFRALSSGRLTLPDEDSVLSMYDYTVDLLKDEGFVHYEISNFSRRGFQCVHNLNYWNRGEYTGAGAGAHSFSGTIRSQNPGDVEEYIVNFSKDSPPGLTGQPVTPEEARREYIFLGLRKTEGINISADMLNGLSLRESCKDLMDNGLLTLQGDFLSLTRKGIVISNTVIVDLLEALGL